MCDLACRWEETLADSTAPNQDIYGPPDADQRKTIREAAANIRKFRALRKKLVVK